MTTKRPANEPYEPVSFKIGSGLAGLASSSALAYHDIEEERRRGTQDGKEKKHPELKRLSEILGEAIETLKSEHATLSYNKTRNRPNSKALEDSETLRMTLDLMHRYKGQDLRGMPQAEATEIARDFYKPFVSRLQTPEGESQYTAMEMKYFCKALIEAAIAVDKTKVSI